MSVYKDQLDHIFLSALERYHKELASISVRHAAEGQFHSGATLLKFKDAAYSTLEEFPESAFALLTEIPSEHSPVKQSDFKLAQGMVFSLRAAIEAEFFRRADRIKDVPVDYRRIPNEKLNRLERSGRSKLLVAERHFVSERSLSKRLVLELKQRSWSAALTVLGGGTLLALATFGGPIGKWIASLF